MHFYKPEEVIEANINSGIVKANMPLGKMILLGILAGAFIALGGAASSTAVHDIANVGLARTLTGVIFPIGLMMIVFVGGELFTGNCMIVKAVFEKKVTIKQFLRNLAVVYVSNLVGALVIDGLVFLSGNLDYSGGLLGAYAIKIAIAKVNMEPVAAIASGILCNMLVCTAILMAGAAIDISGKVWAIFFPIMSFVVGGFEHCVANMFYIPLGMLAATNPEYVAMAQEAYGITAEQCEGLTLLQSLHNFVPVTIGNVIGGALCVGAMCVVIYRKNWDKKNRRRYYKNNHHHHHNNHNHGHHNHHEHHDNHHNHHSNHENHGNQHTHHNNHHGNHHNHGNHNNNHHAEHKQHDDKKTPQD